MNEGRIFGTRSEQLSVEYAVDALEVAA